jgi:hypothetical protein
MQRVKAWGKTLFVLFAVGAALVGTMARMPLSRAEKRLYGAEVRLPEAVGLVFIVRGPYGESVTGNAFLVDEQYHLYMTAAHVVNHVRYGFVRLSDGERLFVKDVWLDAAADLAVFETTTAPKGVTALSVATGPPKKDEQLFCMGYQPVGDPGPGREPRIYGFSRPFTVVRPVTDSCLDSGPCSTQEFIRMKILLGIPFDDNDRWRMYPYAIYAYHDPASGSERGLVSGMSGGPLIDSRGLVVGVNSHYYANTVYDRHGNHALFAPAYRAHILLVQARMDIAARGKK